MSWAIGLGLNLTTSLRMTVLHVGIGPGGELIDAIAGDGVSDNRNNRAVVGEAIAERGPHRRMLGCRCADAYIVDVERRAGHELGHANLRFVDQLIVVGDAVADVGFECAHLTFDELRCARRTVYLQRRIALAQDPVGRDHVVVQRAHMVAVQVG